MGYMRINMVYDCQYLVGFLLGAGLRACPNCSMKAAWVALKFGSLEMLRTTLLLSVTSIIEFDLGLRA